MRLLPWWYFRRSRGVDGTDTKLGHNRAVYVNLNIFVNHFLCRREDRRINLQNNGSSSEAYFIMSSRSTAGCGMHGMEKYCD